MAVVQPRYLRSILIALLFVFLIFYTFSQTNFNGQDDTTGWSEQEPTPIPEEVSQSIVNEIPPTTTSSEPTALEKLVAGVVDDVQASAATPGAPNFNVGQNHPHSSPSEETKLVPHKCYSFEQLQYRKQEPLSGGSRKFPYSRQESRCRTFNSTSLETLLERMKGVIKDPDLYRLFENTYPNTLDTTIKWRGYANKTDSVTQAQTSTDEELAFVITGDIDAMWLRDSASQILSYLPLLEPSDDPDSLASLWRGMINSHARYIIISPYCHSFQPPPESGIPGQVNGAFHNNNPKPAYNPILVFDCKWELDSLASFLQISVAYYQRTKDIKFFEKYNWLSAVQAAVDAAGAMRLGTYSADGHVEQSAWTFTGYTNRGSETLTNDGLGNPTKGNGMVRSAFRPSDDASIYQLLVPANMMFASYLESASEIASQLKDARASNLTTVMLDFAFGIRQGIDKDAIIPHKEFGDIFAYEIDGFGSANMMDDANIPSLLAIPLWDFLNPRSGVKVPEGMEKKDYYKIYENTRKFVLSDNNPYWSKGPVLSAVGGPHLGPGKGWPMAAIVRALTAMKIGGKDGKEIGKEVEDEVTGQLKMLLDSTGGTGVMHESVNAWNGNDWTRAWFGWANGLFGELILKIEEEDKKRKVGRTGLLSQSWQ